MSLIQHSGICACQQCSTDFVKSSVSEIFKFSDNSKFSISDQTDWSTDYELQKAHVLLP